MKKTCLFVYLFIGLLAYWIITPKAFATSPHLELSPSSGSISTSGTNINVDIDTGGLEAKSAKAVINFDATKLEVTSIQEGTFFDEVSYNIYNTTGQVIINANLSLGSALETKTGTGTLATMTVRAKTASGIANMTFDCTPGSSTDSGINDPTPTDIIDCASNINGSYSLEAGIGIGGAASSASATASPSALPETGITGPTVGLLALALGLILISFPLFLFV